MKTAIMIVAVLIIALMPQIGQTADLQAGWYVKLGNIALWGFDPVQNREVAVGWYFTTPVGLNGPFEVTQPAPSWPQRMVSVPTSVNVPSGTSVDLYGSLEKPITFPIYRLDVGHETDYDSSQMLVQLLVQHSNGSVELLWSEPRSGHHLGANNILGPSETILPTDTLLFKVVAVPEPSQCAMLTISLLGMLLMRRRASR